MKQKQYNIILLSLIAIAAIIWQLSGVAWVDDLQYMRMPGDNIRFWYNEGPFITNFIDACESVYYHHISTTSRLPNYIQCFTNLIPGPMTDICHGLMFALLVYVIAKTITNRCDTISPLVIALSALCMWGLLPWYDNMISSDFFLNYVYTSVICLFYIHIFINNDILQGRMRSLQWVVTIVASMSHEGFTFPIIAASILMILLSPVDRRRRIRLTIVLSIGVAFCFFTPGIFERLHERLSDKSIGAMVIFKESLLQIEAVYIMLLTIGIITFTRGAKHIRILLHNEIFFITTLLCSYAIAIISGTVHRGLWLTELSAIIITLRILIRTYSLGQRPHRLTALAVTALTLFSIIDTARWQQLFSTEIKDICKQVETSGRPIAYIDLINPGLLPWWTFDIPKSISSSYGNRCYAFHYGYTNDFCNILILPSHFKNLPVSQWDKMDGSAQARGQYPFFVTTYPTNGKLTIHCDDYLPAAGLIDRILGFISREKETIRTIEFSYHWSIVAENGDTLYCHNIDHLSRTMRNREITAINNPDKLLK